MLIFGVISIYYYFTTGSCKLLYITDVMTVVTMCYLQILGCVFMISGSNRGDDDSILCGSKITVVVAVVNFCLVILRRILSNYFCT